MHKINNIIKLEVSDTGIKGRIRFGRNSKGWGNLPANLNRTSDTIRNEISAVGLPANYGNIIVYVKPA